MYPYIVHHSIRPVQMSFAGDPKYQKLQKSYVKLRSLISNTYEFLFPSPLTVRNRRAGKLQIVSSVAPKLPVPIFWKSMCEYFLWPVEHSGWVFDLFCVLLFIRKKHSLFCKNLFYKNIEAEFSKLLRICWEYTESWDFSRTFFAC